MLKVDWVAPGRGVTNEQVESYIVECSFKEGIEAYTLKHIVANDISKAFLPTGGNLSTAGYNCCVEAVFETYSSRACIVTSSQLILKDNQQQVICSSKRTIQIVAGVLASVIVFLLVTLVIVLIYLWRIMIQQGKEKCPKRSVIAIIKFFIVIIYYLLVCAHYYTQCSVWYWTRKSTGKSITWRKRANDSNIKQDTIGQIQQHWTWVWANSDN